MGARLLQLAAGSLLTLIGVSVVSASAAANTVPESRADLVDQALLFTWLLPPECAGMPIDRLQVGPGGNGGGNALVLGTSGNETLTGGGGDDCIIAGAGSTVLNGQGGNDVLISGPGLVDFLNGSGGIDTCYGRGFSSVPSSCETYVP